MNIGSSPLTVGRAEDQHTFTLLQQHFSEENPGYNISTRLLKGGTHWSAPSGVLFLWLESGKAEARLVADAVEQNSWETLEPGDVLVLDATHSAHLRGDARFWEISTEKRNESPFAGLRRLKNLADQSGGCNISANAFRRLQITWQSEGVTPEQPDGVNLLGCHVVYIAEKTSRAHYHPAPPRTGGQNQHELYLVLDPQYYGLNRGTEKSGVWTNPTPGNGSHYDFTPLRPGDIVSINAGVAHRAVEILACVIALPGFKPGNDVYIEPA